MHVSLICTCILYMYWNVNYIHCSLYTCAVYASLKFVITVCGYTVMSPPCTYMYMQYREDTKGLMCLQAPPKPHPTLYNLIVPVGNLLYPRYT